MGAAEVLFETSFYRDFVGLSGTQRIPDRVSILSFRHLLEEHELSPKILQVINAKLAALGLLLKTGSVVDGYAPGQTQGSEAHAVGRAHGASRKPQGQRACQGRASISGYQTAVWSYQGALSRTQKNTAPLNTLFALSNIWMARGRLLQTAQA